MVRKQVLRDFELKIKKITNKRDLVNPDFHEQSSKLHEQFIQEFKSKSQHLIIEDTDWGEKVEVQVQEISNQMDREIMNTREKEMTKL